MDRTTVEFPYQDSTLSVEQRVEDLLSRMELADKAGLAFQPLAGFGGFDDDGVYGSPNLRSLFERRINHFNILSAPTARELAAWNNAVQEEVRRQPLGIPVTISTDPRHAFTNNPATSLFAGPFSQWPEPLGFAAIGDPLLVKRFGDIVRREYAAVGLRTALHPQIDLASDPRWARASTTFGSDAEQASVLGVHYIAGLQGDRIGTTSVSAMAKHFPGGGPQKDGEDPHFAYGREQVYPGDRFDLHLEPFKAAIAAGVSQIMPYYGMPVGLVIDGEPIEEVGFSFNKQIITGLLRETLGFDGIICTDWGILANICWGVEDLTYEERMIKAFEAGVDQFGGEFRPKTLARLVSSGAINEDRLDDSVRRLLREKFRLGLFDNPFVDADAADTIVGNSAVREEGVLAQAAAQTLLKNADSGSAHLPLTPGLKIYVEGLSADAAARHGTIVENPADADVAIVRTVAPWENRGASGEFESFFHAGSLAFSEAEIAHITDLGAIVPTVVDVYLDRPALLGQITGGAASLLANFGSSDDALLRVLFGELEPQGRLPFEIPSSMDAVVASKPDVPNDTTDPTFSAGFGLRYT